MLIVKAFFTFTALAGPATAAVAGDTGARTHARDLTRVGPALKKPEGHVKDGVPLESRESASYRTAVLAHHNVHRANHSAPDLVWGNKVASSAKAWADKCTFAHNTEIGGGGYGQNLFAGSKDVGDAITEAWYNGEQPNFKYYGQDNPDFNKFEDFGHFSQLVWADTHEVGCYTANCTKSGLKNVGGSVPPYLTVCNYSPPGNFGGEWAKNVKQPLGKAKVDAALS